MFHANLISSCMRISGDHSIKRRYRALSYQYLSSDIIYEKNLRYYTRGVNKFHSTRWNRQPQNVYGTKRHILASTVYIRFQTTKSKQKKLRYYLRYQGLAVKLTFSGAWSSVVWKMVQNISGKLLPPSSGCQTAELHGVTYHKNVILMLLVFVSSQTGRHYA
jgi:hypothetical protein